MKVAMAAQGLRDALRSLLRDAPAGVPEGQLRQLAEALHQNFVQSTRVAVMGQTGVGKSSIINALFGCSLEVGDIKPTTTEPAEVTQALQGGRSLTFVDLPGMGESPKADAAYAAMYERELENADIVLWLFSAESRSIVTDMNTMASLAGDERSRDALTSKVTFALTKADLVAHPWLLSYDGDRASFTPHPDRRGLLEAKARYIADAIEDRLAFAPGAVPVTSTLFRVGLPELLSAIFNKTDSATAWRTRTLFDVDALDRLPLQKALAHRNFVIVNERTHEVRDVAVAEGGMA